MTLGKAVLSLFLVAFASTLDLQAAEVDDLIVARAGNLPIVLTAPHGGQNVVPGARLRTSGVLTTDARTMELAEALENRLKEILGAKPYFVAAKFRRNYIDANRSEAEAFEDASARPVYLAYHERIREYVDAVRQKYPSGALLLDIHGQATDADTVFRGTQNGKTVESLLGKHGLTALSGEKSVLGVLRSRGRTVFPVDTPLNNPRENPRYNGGYTVQTYGSNNRDGIDAIQVELGANLRRTPRFVDDLAEAIAVYYRTYLADPR
jgi:N-formylglutamate amidohydrolase